MQVDLFLIRIGAPLCSQVMVIDFYVSGQGIVRGNALFANSSCCEVNSERKEFALKRGNFSFKGRPIFIGDLLSYTAKKIFFLRKITKISIRLKDNISFLFLHKTVCCDQIYNSS